MATKEMKKDIEELKAAMTSLNADVMTVSNQQQTIMNLMKEIKDLKMQNAELVKKTDYLENRVSDLEQYSRMNDVIITGLKIKPRSYSHALTKDKRVESPDHEESTEEQVTAFLIVKNISIDKRNIEACHTLPTRRVTMISHRKNFHLFS